MNNTDRNVRVSGAGVTLTFPSVGANDDGHVVWIRNTDASNAVTIDASDADNVDGSATQSLTAGSAVRLVYVHALTDWVLFGGSF